MIDPPDLSPGSSPWDTNRTNRTRSCGGKYESAHFLTPARLTYLFSCRSQYETVSSEQSVFKIDGMDIVNNNAYTDITEYKDGAWNHVGDLHQARRYHIAIPSGALVMIMGGYDGSQNAE